MYRDTQPNPALANPERRIRGNTYAFWKRVSLFDASIIAHPNGDDGENFESS